MSKENDSHEDNEESGVDTVSKEVEFDLSTDVKESIVRMEEYEGSSYVQPEWAVAVLSVIFYQKEGVGGEDGIPPDIATSRRVGEVAIQAQNAQGGISLLPHEQVVVVSDVSAMAIEALGATPSKYDKEGKMIEDMKHEENIEMLKIMTGLDSRLE